MASIIISTTPSALVKTGSIRRRSSGYGVAGEKFSPKSGFFEVSNRLYTFHMRFDDPEFQAWIDR